LNIPDWLKCRLTYQARAAVLSLIGSPRFYSPLSAPKLYVPSTVRNGAPMRDAVEVSRREDNLNIWHSPLGDLATVCTEVKDHLAFLVAEFDRDVYERGAVHICSGDLVLDVGANIGIFSIKALRRRAGHVVAVEPAPDNSQALRWNLAADILAKRVTVVDKGAWNEVCTLRMIVDPKYPGQNSCVVRPPGNDNYEIAIEAAPLDQIVYDLRLPRVEFIKMDVEGSELRALEGAKDILRRYTPQLAIAVEHTDNRLLNAFRVRQLVSSINPKYHCVPGPCTAADNRLVPDILYFTDGHQ
jgi:FkbM family methyltransferase